MKILLTGATGQLGREICRSRLASGTRLIAASRAQLDLTRPSEIDGFVGEIAPDLVVNAAAYTAVDRAQSDPELAFAINRDGAASLSKAAAAHGAAIVHFSTDYVFDGSKDGEWTEEDRPNPLSVYGESKLIGEIAVAAANPRHLILRTSWLYAGQGHNFLRTMLRIGKDRTRLPVVADQIGRPTAAADLADTALGMAMQAMQGEGAWGLYHVCNSGPATSWHGFASAIFSKAARWSGIPPILEPITTEAFGAPAPRPRNSALALGKLQQVYGLTPRPWHAALCDVLDEMRREQAMGAS
ncbi:MULTISPECIES: dTDP-4-dehydrorhamnose reductase [Rhodomicrobium]|uniref:dTDP-4-dehydrorhamnose reductase n=1 Tax=Rhodomicrobium TaxID=1068 RepID=UPI000B4B30E9|nr:MULTISPECIES: dTDP-4-dehydrorhamnose reductase [Rhodomicrobium]